MIANCAVADSANIIPRCEKKYVRVETYRSVMVVRAHKTFDCKGFDYILSYYDNPESNIPKYAYNWLVNCGGPYYLHQVVAIDFFFCTFPVFEWLFLEMKVC